MSILEKKFEGIMDTCKRSRISGDFDKRADEAIASHRRLHFLKSIRKSIQLVVDYAQKMMKTNDLKQEDLIIYSSYMTLVRQRGVREGYITTVTSSIPTVFGQPTYRPEFLKKMDGHTIRIMYFDEFTSRCKVLLKAVKRGELDSFFGTPPFDVLHQIIGRYGELLPRLSIDPMESRIASAPDILMKRNRTRL